MKLSRPNLRCRSSDDLEEERCYESFEESMVIGHRRIVDDEFGNGDMLIENLTSDLKLTLIQAEPPKVIAPKPTGFLQLKKRRKSIFPLSASNKQQVLENMHKNIFYWQDNILPRGSITTIGHSMIMGSMGTIDTALFRNKYRVALKKQENNQSSDSLQKEIALLKYVGSHPTILTCHGYIMNGNVFQTVYELAPFGSLDRILLETKVQFPLSLIIGWLYDIADAMAFLHSKGLIHNAISAENVLVFERLEVKLCNFQSITSTLPTTDSFSKVALKDNRIDHPSVFSADFSGFFNTVLQIFSGKGHLLGLAECMPKMERDKRLEETLLSRPFHEFSCATRLYHVLTAFTAYEHTSKPGSPNTVTATNNSPSNIANNKKRISSLPASSDLSHQLFSILEEFFEGDPREPFNELFRRLQRYELLLKSRIIDFVPLPQKSRHRQKIFGSTMLRKDSSDHSLLAIQEQQLQNPAQKILDPRTQLIEWFYQDFKASYPCAEELATYSLRNGIYSKTDFAIKLKANPKLFQQYLLSHNPNDMHKDDLINKMKEKFLSKSVQ